MARIKFRPLEPNEVDTKALNTTVRMLRDWTIELLVPLTGIQVFYLTQYIPLSAWREGVYQHSQVSYQDPKGVTYKRAVRYQAQWYWASGEEFPKHYQRLPDPGLKQIKELHKKQVQGTLSPQEKEVLQYWSEVNELRIWDRMWGYLNFTM